jgi:hypothetical protein
MRSLGMSFFCGEAWQNTIVTSVRYGQVMTFASSRTLSFARGGPEWARRAGR